LRKRFTTNPSTSSGQEARRARRRKEFLDRIYRMNRIIREKERREVYCRKNGKGRFGFIDAN
jgi:hypothetical protein